MTELLLAVALAALILFFPKLARFYVFWTLRKARNMNQVANVQAPAPKPDPTTERAMAHAVNIVIGMTKRTEVAIEDWKKRTGKTVAECQVLYDEPIVTDEEIVWTMRLRTQDRGLVQ